ncbi:MAG: hypothetical protein WDN67_01200 [Candidatus Moraniibacteriota bacterium]
MSSCAALRPFAGAIHFLAGPIQGAAILAIFRSFFWLQELGAQVHIASPRRAIVHEGDFDEEMYDEQVKWEHYHLDHAQFRGLVLFWLPPRRATQL